MTRVSSPPKIRLKSLEAQKRVAELTDEGAFELSDAEEWWRDRYELFLAHGYRMRPRFRPGWVPSWKGNDLNPSYCEDSRPIINIMIMDAVRISDGAVVVVKKARKRRNEGTITQLFSTSERASARENHCVPVYDIFYDENQEFEFIVMPLLREFDDPPFENIEQAVDFVAQTLEGLKYMHQEGVAHLDCSVKNIMMDASPLFPEGYHPVYDYLDKNCIYKAKRRRRADAGPLKYYFIDFGLSIYTLLGDESRTIGTDCQDKEVPELSADESYLALPVDIFILGNVYKKKLLNVYSNLEFLRPLVEAMTQTDPSARPSSATALSQFKQLQFPKWGASLRWRLYLRDETNARRIFGDAVACARETALFLKSIVTAPLKLTKHLASSISNVRI